MSNVLLLMLVILSAMLVILSAMLVILSAAKDLVPKQIPSHKRATIISKD